MKDTLEVADVDTYNMAEKSNWFARAFNTNDAEVKSLMTEQDAPKNIEPQELTIVQKRGGPRRAVILVEPLEDMARTSSGTSSGATVAAPVVVEETYSEETVVEPNPASGLSRTDDIHSQPVAGTDEAVVDEDDRGTESAATIPRQPKEEFIAPTLDDYGTQQDPVRKDGTELFERPSTNLSD
jgi:hypothetical protein